jgi:hypothetical protein
MDRGDRGDGDVDQSDGDGDIDNLHKGDTSSNGCMRARLTVWTIKVISWTFSSKRSGECGRV